MSLDPTSPSSPKSTSPTRSQPAPTSGRGGVSEKLSVDKKEETFQIFLGGSCNPTTWRQSVAIPFLEMNGITYYNPQVDNWTPELVKTERFAKQSAQVLLFVLDEQTRSTVSLVESAFMAAEGKKLVLVIYPFDYHVLSLTDTTEQTTSNTTETRRQRTRMTTKNLPSSNQGNFTSSSVLQTSCKTVSSFRHASGTIKIDGEMISVDEFYELGQARSILQSLVNKHNTAMFTNILEALEYVTKCLAVDKSSRNSEIHTKGAFTTKDQELKSSANDSDIEVVEFTSSTRDRIEIPQRDVYLMLDDYDDRGIESSLIHMIQQQGLSHYYRPLREIVNSKHKNTSFLTKDEPLSLTNKQPDIDTTSGMWNAFDEQHSTLSLAKEISTVKASRVLLLVITNKCRGLSIMVLASYYMALFRNNVVLCIQYLEEPCSINGELLSKNAVADYNRGRVYLCDYAVKSQVPVFKTIKEAVDCCSQRCGIRNIKD